jgi:hypothetical protein
MISISHGYRIYINYAHRRTLPETFAMFAGGTGKTQLAMNIFYFPGQNLADSACSGMQPGVCGSEADPDPAAPSPHTAIEHGLSTPT